MSLPSLPSLPARSLMEHADSASSASGMAAGPFEFEDVPRLTRALRDGDEDAYAWLHREWSRRINRYCFALAAGDEAFAREIAQTTWLRLVKHVRVMNDEQTLWNWIAKAARNSATDHRRKGSRYLQALCRFSEWWMQKPAPSHGDSPDALLAALEQALKKLTSDERALLEGRYFSEHSLEAIGQHRSLSARAVEGRLARIRARLREMISEELHLT